MEPKENSEQTFSNDERMRVISGHAHRKLIALMLRRSRIAVGGEFAVSDGVLVVLVAIIDRAHGAVGLHCKSILAGLFQLREKDPQIKRAISGGLCCDHFAFVRLQKLPWPAALNKVQRTLAGAGAASEAAVQRNPASSCLSRNSPRM